MTKKITFKLIAVLFVVLALVTGILTFSTSYAKWVNDNPSKIQGAAQIGEWKSYYVLLDDGTVFPLTGDQGGNGGANETYTGEFKTTNDNVGFRVYYNNEAVTHSLKAGQSLVEKDASDPSKFIAKSAAQYKVYVDGEEISFTAYPLNLATMSDDDINALLGGKPGIVTTTGRVIPIPDLASENGGAEVTLSGGEELVIMINGARANTSIFSVQYSINNNGTWKASDQGNRVIVMNGEENVPYTVSVKSWLGAGVTKQIYIEPIK